MSTFNDDQLKKDNETYALDLESLTERIVKLEKEVKQVKVAKRIQIIEDTITRIKSDIESGGDLPQHMTSNTIPHLNVERNRLMRVLANVMEEAR